MNTVASLEQWKISNIKKEYRGIVGAMEGFKHMTTAHGIHHVFHANRWWKKMMWALLGLASLSALMYNGYEQVDKYLSYEASVSVTIKNNMMMTFPAVTVCNNNPVLNSLIQNVPAFYSLMSGTSTSTSSSSSTNSSTNSSSTSSTGSVPTGGSNTNTGSNSITNSNSSGITDGAVNSSSNTVMNSGIQSLSTSTTTTTTTSHAAGSSQATGSTSSSLPSVSDSASAATVNYVQSPTLTTLQSAVSVSASSGTGLQQQAASSTPSSSQSGSSSGSGSVSGSSQQQYGTGQSYKGFGGGTLDVRAPGGGGPMRSGFALKLKAEALLATMSETEKMALGHQVNDLIVDCEFAGATCYPSWQFTSFFHGVYGNCYTFNSGWNESQSLQVSSRVGPQYGLSLTFNLNQDDYSPDLAEGAGLRVVIHDQAQMPFPEYYGIAVSPGQLTYIGASMSCYQTCLQRNLIETCGCGDCQYPLNGTAFGSNEQHKACDIMNSTQVTCMSAVTTDYQNGKLDCSCLASCNQTSFKPTYSSMVWPSDAYTTVVLNNLAATNNLVKTMLNSGMDNTEYEKNIGKTMLNSGMDNTKYEKNIGKTMLNSGMDNTKYKRNLGKVVVYLETFEAELIEESEAYEVFALVCDIGGILGLYVGFSILTIVEFIDFGFELVCASCVTLTKRSARNGQHGGPQGHGGQGHRGPQGHGRQGHRGPQGHGRQGHGGPQGHCGQGHCGPQGHGRQGHGGPQGHGAQRHGPVSRHAAIADGQVDKEMHLKGGLFAGTLPPAYIGLESKTSMKMVDVEC